MSHVAAAIESNRERFLAEFCEFLSFPSESGNGKGLAGAADWMLPSLIVLGAEVQVLSTGMLRPPSSAKSVRGDAACSATRTTMPSSRPTHWNNGSHRLTRRRCATASSTPAVRWTRRVTRCPASMRSRSIRPSMASCRCGSNSSSRARKRSAARIWQRWPSATPICCARHGAIWEGGGFDDAERYTFYCGVKGIVYLELRIRGVGYDLHSAMRLWRPTRPGAWCMR